MTGTPRFGRSVFAPDSHEPADREVPPEPATRERLDVARRALGVRRPRKRRESRLSAASDRRVGPEDAGPDPVEDPRDAPRTRDCLRCGAPFPSAHRFNRCCPACTARNARVDDGQLQDVFARRRR